MRVIRPAPLALLGAVVVTSVAAALPPARTAPARPAVAAVADGPGAPPDGATPAEAARRAAELHQQAMDAGSVGKWRRAAALHKRAAALHSAEDPRGARCLELAANFAYYGGDRPSARVLLETAADQALARGDLATAADAYLKAGLVARDLGDRPGEAAHARRAKLLAASPLLSEAQRAGITARIVTR
jgi:hypothetical protein